MSYKQLHKHFSNKSTNTPFGGYFLVIWLNGSFFMLSCSKTSLTGKTGSTENPRLHWKLETRIGDATRAQIIRWDSFVTSNSKTFSWKSTMYNFFKDKLQLAEAVVRRCSVIKVFLKVSRNSKKNSCADVSLFLENLLKSDPNTGVFLGILRIF